MTCGGGGEGTRIRRIGGLEGPWRGRAGEHGWGRPWRRQELADEEAPGRGRGAGAGVSGRGVRDRRVVLWVSRN